MKDAYEVLRQKEAELARLRHDIDCLRIAAPLLSEEPTSQNLNSQSERSEETRVEQEPESKATGTESLSSSSDSRPKLWGVLKRGQ